MPSKNFVIVGGSHGIGLEIVRRLDQSGEASIVLSRSSDTLTGLRNVAHLPWDATQDELDAASLPSQIDGLVYCPGSINLRAFKSLTPALFRDDFELNVIGAIKAIQASLTGLRAAPLASIVLFSTVAVQQGMPAHASVAASKGAIEGLTRTLANEFAPQIRVNCIAPALTHTKMTERFFRDEDRVKTLGEQYPLGRTGKPADIAAMASLLLSEEGSWITGQVIGVDGGISSVRK